MAPTDERERNVSAPISDVSVPALAVTLLLGIYVVAQATITARWFVVPDGGGVLVTGSADAGSVPETVVSAGNMVGNHFAGAPVFALFVVSVAGYVVWRGHDPLVVVLGSVLGTLAIFLGAVSVGSLGTIPDVSAYLTAAVALGTLYGALGALGGMTAVAVRD